MVKITSFLFRNRLEEDIDEIINDKHTMELAANLKTIIQLNSAFAPEVLKDIRSHIMPAMGNYSEHHFSGRVKAKVKNKISDLRKVYDVNKFRDEKLSAHYGISSQINPLTYMIDLFIKKPKKYFLRTPFTGRLFFSEDEGVVSVTREKLYVRTAEKKVWGRNIDKLKKFVDIHAINRAVGRAIASGRKSLIGFESTEELKEKDFEQGEKDLSDTLTDNQLYFSLEGKDIDDAIGLKWILKSYESLDEVLDFFQSGPFKIENPKMDIDHKNDDFYKATHATVTYTYNPKVYDEALHLMEWRGSDFVSNAADMREKAEKKIKLEVIIISKPYFVVSEIGPSQHEEMIFEKWENQKKIYNGYMAGNLVNVIEYIFGYGQKNTKLTEFPLQFYRKWGPNECTNAFDELVLMR